MKQFKQKQKKQVWEKNILKINQIGKKLDNLAEKKKKNRGEVYK